jgi:hypothetical protein
VISREGRVRSERVRGGEGRVRVREGRVRSAEGDWWMKKEE